MSGVRSTNKTVRIFKNHGNGPGGKGVPWEATVDVYLNTDTAQPDFDIKTGNLPTQGQDPKHPVLVFNEFERDGGFLVRFCLWDNTGNKAPYRFPKIKEAAIWSQYGNTCPTNAVWDVLVPRKVSSDGLTLTVFNANNPADLFRYRLRVTTDDVHFVEMDPGGANMNGSSLN